MLETTTIFWEIFAVFTPLISSDSLFARLTAYSYIPDLHSTATLQLWYIKLIMSCKSLYAKCCISYIA